MPDWPDWPDWLTAELATVPEYETFLDADEHETHLADLAARYPDLAILEQVGTSRLGDPIHALRIGDAPTNALVFGLPHPNEPIGGLSALHLAGRLCEDAELRERLGLSFTIVACIDPDGLRLNDGWLKGPYTRAHYARHFYRPPGHEQVEWTFPLNYKNASFDAVLPETRALMRLIDELQPVFMCSLHNSEMGGAYYYLSRPEPELYDVLQWVPEQVGVPLDRGEPEHPSIPKLADGVYEGLSARAVYDYLEAEGLDPTVVAVAGETSSSYAEKYGTLTLICEVPYWTDPRSDDTTATSQLYCDALREQGELMQDTARPLSRMLEEFLRESTVDSPWLRASTAFIPHLAEFQASLAPRLLDPANERPATVAELFSLHDMAQSARLRFGGMLWRAIVCERHIGNHTPAVRALEKEARELVEAWITHPPTVDESSALSIRSLVATQYAATLAAAEIAASSS